MTVIYPGTFDPIHIGHINSALSVIQYLNPDTFIFLLHHNAFKDEEMFTISTRLKFIYKFVNKYCSRVSNYIAIDQYNGQYLIDVIRERYAKRLETEEVYLLIGDDCLDEIHQWNNIHGMLKLVKLCVIQRNFSLYNIKQKLNTLGYQATIVPQNTIAHMSSTIVKNDIFQYVENYK